MDARSKTSHGVGEAATMKTKRVCFFISCLTVVVVVVMVQLHNPSLLQPTPRQQQQHKQQQQQQQQQQQDQHQNQQGHYRHQQQQQQQQEHQQQTDSPVTETQHKVTATPSFQTLTQRGQGDREKSWRGTEVTAGLSPSRQSADGRSQGQTIHVNGQDDRKPVTCPPPVLDPYDPSLLDVLEKFPTLQCGAGLPSVIVLRDDFMLVDPEKVKDKLKKVKIQNCRYRSHVMKSGGDYNTTMSDWSRNFTEKIRVKPSEEHFIAECYSDSDQLVARTYISVVKQRPKLEKTLEERYRKHVTSGRARETLSVMVVGVDGMSRQNMVRAMPRTRSYLLDTLGGVELTNYNKNGMNTFPNVMTLVTGKTVEEHSAYWNTSQHFDSLHYVWDDFEQAGYRTQMVLDTVKVTSFHCSKQGFSRPPVHYYNRPTVIASERDTTVRHKDNNCIGDTPEVTSLTDYLLQMATVFNTTAGQPYFSYSFFVRLTHDNTHMGSAGDQLYLDFVTTLHQAGHLNNTVLVLFSDHGPRFGPLRRTVVGMMEDRMPFCFLVFPPWFLKKYPDVARALSINQARLTSHFDLHATLKDILYFQGKTKADKPTSRSISLLREIPRQRSCLEAGINFQWCSCTQMTKLDTNQLMVKLLAYEFALKLSDMTRSARSLCHQLNLKSIMYAMLVSPDSGQWPDEMTLYQVTIETTPGDAVFEAMLQFSSSTNQTEIVGTVLRLNMFQPQSECVDSPSLKPFCYCKDLEP